jgi:predicted  nucleic acid-binding Zn-ribbon protein
LRAAIAEAEAEIDEELAKEDTARAQQAEGVPASLLADYERRRAQNKGAGAARLVGTSCTACHLSIPSTEAERIRRGAGSVVAYCDNCGAILVP